MIDDQSQSQSSNINGKIFIITMKTLIILTKVNREEKEEARMNKMEDVLSAKFAEKVIYLNPL